MLSENNKNIIMDIASIYHIILYDSIFKSKKQGML